jgi:hypothetical protein
MCGHNPIAAVLRPEPSSYQCLNQAQQYQPPTSPESDLQDLIRRELKVNVSQGELRMFLRYHWKEVAALAHKIHAAA